MKTILLIQDSHMWPCYAVMLNYAQIKNMGKFLAGYTEQQETKRSRRPTYIEG